MGAVPEDILLQNPGLMLVNLANNMMTVRRGLRRGLGRGLGGLGWGWGGGFCGGWGAEGGWGRGWRGRGLRGLTRGLPWLTRGREGGWKDRRTVGSE